MYDKCSDCEYGDVENLRLENQELKKQLETVRKKYKFESKNRDKIWKILIEKETTQKKFIAYLEDKLKILEMFDRDFFLTNNKKEIKTCKEVLLKYKEIIGEKDE